MTALPPAPDGGAAPGTGPLALGSLCTGYAGLDMAVSAVLDVRPAWVADPDPGAAAILAHHYPDVPNLGDITAVDWTAVQPVDVVCGGYPCQPFSIAGQRKGTADARHLWPHIADALRVLRPRVAVFENVANHLRLGFADVLADLAGLGFDAEWCLVRADEVGAPHQRRRLFVLAVAQDADRAACGERRQPAPRQAQGGRPRTDARGRGRAPAPHAARLGHGDAGASRVGGMATPALTGAPTDADRDPVRQQPVPVTRSGGAPVAEQHRATPADPDGDGRRLVQREQPGMGTRDHADRRSPERHIEWGGYGPAVERWARVLGRPAPRPTEPGRTGERLSPAFVEWLMGLSAGHVTAVPGLTRNAQLRALGNGVVPAQGAAALSLLLDRIGAAA